jgi:hypothetical protein
MQLCPEWFFFVVLVFCDNIESVSFMFISLQQTKRNEKYGLILGNWQLTVTSIFLISGQAHIMSTVLSAILFKIFTSNMEECQAFCSNFGCSSMA